MRSFQSRSRLISSFSFRNLTTGWKLIRTSSAVNFGVGDVDRGGGEEGEMAAELASLRRPRPDLKTIGGEVRPVGGTCFAALSCDLRRLPKASRTSTTSSQTSTPARRASASRLAFLCCEMKAARSKENCSFAEVGELPGGWRLRRYVLTVRSRSSILLDAGASLSSRMLFW